MTRNPADHYAVLGVSRRASAEAIRAAYVAHIKVCHPDYAAAMPEAFDRFYALQRAYDCLRSPEMRAIYDRETEDYARQRMRRINRARRRLKRIEHRRALAMPAREGLPHGRAAAIVALSGLLILSVAYLWLR